MQAQTQTQTKPTAADYSAATDAINVYLQARKAGHRPLDIILGIWGTPKWSDPSKELFLAEIRSRFPIDRSIKRLDYTFTEISNHYKIRQQYGGRDRAN